MPNPNFVANGNVSPCRFVMLDTTATEANKVLQAGSNLKLMGIASEGGREAPLPVVGTTMYAAKAGDGLQVYGDNDVCLLEITGTAIPGMLLRADANGKGIACTTAGSVPMNVGAIALGPGADGERIRVQVMIRHNYFNSLA